MGVNDGLALFCANRPEFVEVMFACERAGIRVTPIRSDLTPREAQYILADCQAKAIIADTSVGELLADTIRCHTGIEIKLMIGGAPKSTESYEAALASASPRQFEAGETGIPMFYTSGTTGTPKGVYRRERISRSAMVAVGEQLKLSSSRDLGLAPLALCRPGVFNLSVRLPLVCGVSVVLTEEYRPMAILDLISHHRVTYAYLTPFLFHRLLQLPSTVRQAYDITSLRNVLHTGAPCSVALKRQMIEWLGPIITELYAGTEGGDITISSDDWLRKPGSVGKAADRLAIVDEQGALVPAETVGRIFLDAPERGRFEYYNAPEKTRSAYHGDRYTMGDQGYLDAEGYLYLTGRTSEIINSGGLKIYPAEIDAILVQHPAIDDAACIGVPNPEMGEEVKALVRLQPGYLLDETLIAELAALCRDNLAAYKCPGSIDVVDEIPRLTTGKVLRDELRRRFRSI